MRISLVGLPASGKSTVGRCLARRLGLPFFDSDLEIESRSGFSVAGYFERFGEEAFRNTEATVLRQLMLVPTCVVSTGGGVVGRAENREVLTTCSNVVYLHSKPDEVFRRLRNDRSRPLLQVSDPVAKLRDLYVLRDPLYREVAHLVMESGRPSVSVLVREIVAKLQLLNAALPIADHSVLPFE